MLISNSFGNFNPCARIWIIDLHHEEGLMEQISNSWKRFSY
jgi:hypothetical protein